jgi:hypothetical protein
MLRRSVVVLLGGLLLLPAAQTRAQSMPFAGEGIPLGADLASVPVGAWAEYRVRRRDATGNARVALVARGDKAATLELLFDLGPDAKVKRPWLLQFSVPVAAGVGLTGGPQVLQIGQGAPMRLPTETGGFLRPLAKDLVGEETIELAARKWKVRHYETRRRDEGERHVWISDEAAPLGLVRLQKIPELRGIVHQPPKRGRRPVVDSPPSPSEDAANLAAWGPISEVWELVATGTGARTRVTRAPRPFSPETLMQEMAANVGGQPGATAAKPAK